MLQPSKNKEMLLYLNKLLTNIEIFHCIIQFKIRSSSEIFMSVKHF